MPSRRRFLAALARPLLVVGVAPLVWRIAGPAEAGVPRGPVLEERLVVGLRVKTDSDRQFIARVVELVQAGKLPLRLVDSTYFWARSKAAERRNLANNPMVYFRPALIARAARLGIRI